jgi:hypothetical protein
MLVSSKSADADIFERLRGAASSSLTSVRIDSGAYNPGLHREISLLALTLTFHISSRSTIYAPPLFSFA